MKELTRLQLNFVFCKTFIVKEISPLEEKYSEEDTKQQLVSSLKEEVPTSGEAEVQSTILQRVSELNVFLLSLTFGWNKEYLTQQIFINSGKHSTEMDK